MRHQEEETDRVSKVQSKRSLLEEVTAQAVSDALHSDSPQLRQEAIEWLWVCCPDIAEDLGLPK